MLMFPLSYLINRSGFSAHPICRLLSLVNIVSFTPFFLMGVLVKMHWGAFHRWIENEWFISMVLVVYTGLLAARAMTDLELKLVVYAIPAVLIIYTLFHCFQSIFSSSTMVGASLIYIGKRTLAIYLVHYFLLSGVAPAVLLPIIHKYGGWITGFVAQMLLALIVTGVSYSSKRYYEKQHLFIACCWAIQIKNTIFFFAAYESTLCNSGILGLQTTVL